MPECSLDLEINDLVVMYRNTGDEAYFNQLLEKVRKLVALLAREYVRSIPYAELDDLVSEGYVVLLRAIEDYDLFRGQKFSTMIRQYVTRHFDGMYIRATREKRFIGAVPDSYERIVEAGKDGDVPGAAFTVECQEYRDAEFQAVLERMELSDRERVIVRIFMDGGKPKDCSRALGVTASTISYYVRRLREKFIFSGFAL